MSLYNETEETALAMTDLSLGQIVKLISTGENQQAHVVNSSDHTHLDSCGVVLRAAKQGERVQLWVRRRVHIEATHIEVGTVHTLTESIK